jgi:Cu(I)/Ag(I) efflux system protein CusF
MKMLLAAAAMLALAGPTWAQGAQDPGAADHATAPAGAEGVGVIRKLDTKTGSITLQHGPIAALSWPAMTMPFKADPALLKDLKVGQTVGFTVKAGDTPEVVAIRPK